MLANTEKRRARSCFRPSTLAAEQKEPRRTGPLGLASCSRRYFLLEPEPDDELGDVLWFALGWDFRRQRASLCEGVT